MWFEFIGWYILGHWWECSCIWDGKFSITYGCSFFSWSPSSLCRCGEHSYLMESTSNLKFWCYNMDVERCLSDWIWVGPDFVPGHHAAMESVCPTSSQIYIAASTVVARKMSRRNVVHWECPVCCNSSILASYDLCKCLANSYLTRLLCVDQKNSHFPNRAGAVRLYACTSRRSNMSRCCMWCRCEWISMRQVRWTGLEAWNLANDLRTR